MGRVIKRTLANGLDHIHDFSDLGEASVTWGTKSGWEVEGRRTRHRIHALEHAVARADTMQNTLYRFYRQMLDDADTYAETSDMSTYGHYSCPHALHRKYVRECHVDITRPLSSSEANLEIIALACEQPESAYKEHFEVASQLAARELYAGSPYGRTQLDEAGYKSLTPARIELMRKRFLRPSNLTIVTIGPTDVRKMVDRTFGTIPAAKSDIKLPSFAPPPREEHCVEYDKEGIKKNVYVMHTVRCGELNIDNIVTAEVVAHMLGSSNINLLTTDMRTRASTAYTQHANVSAMRPELTIQIIYTCPPEKLERNKQIVDENLALLALGGPYDKKLFHRFKEYAVAYANGQVGETGGRAEWYINMNALGHFLTVNQYNERLLAVTPRMVQERMSEWMDGVFTLVMYPTGRPVFRKRKSSPDGDVSRHQ